MPRTEKARRSRWIVGIAMVLAVLVIGSGFWFATLFQSPAQQEANAKAPPAGPVFAEVSRGSLTEEISFTGQIGSSTQTQLTILPAPDASLSVVTGHALETGTNVSPGRVLTEVNGRPVFGVHAPFSFYRDMGIGDRGPDVQALQNALAAQSYPVDPDGRFGNETAAAVKRWYGDNGYLTPTRQGERPGGAGPGEGSGSKDVSIDTPSEEYVPVTEVLALPADSAQVLQGLQVGQRVAVADRADLVLGSADAVVTITVPTVALGGVERGDTATITVADVSVVGAVGDVRVPGGSGDMSDLPQDDTGNDAADRGGTETISEVVFTVVPREPLPASSGPARVSVTKQVVAQDKMIVPVLAVSDRGPGHNVLTKRQSDGTLIEVPVTVLGTLQGEVAVEPLQEGALEPGDEVRVG